MGEEEARKCRAGPPTDRNVCFSVTTKNLNSGNSNFCLQDSSTGNKINLVVNT